MKMAKMTNKQMRNWAGILAIVGIYFLFFKKPKSATPIQPPLPPSPSPAPIQIVLEARKMFSVNTKTDPLNVREKPSTSSRIITKLPKDDIFEGARVKNMRWVAVYDIKNKANVKGYVSADYVKEGI